MMNSKLRALESIPDVEIRRDEPLARHTTFRVGGPVGMLARPRSQGALFALLDSASHLGVPFAILGEGSNVLAPDEPLEMMVIELHLACGGLIPGSRTEHGKLLYAGAGARLRDLVGFCIKNGLQGLEALAGVPATVGGALFMNASTSWGAISDRLVQIDLLDSQGVKRSFRREQLSPGYRTMGLPEDCVILGGCFELDSCAAAVLEERVETILEKRRKTQPLRYPSAGSVFKNPPGLFAGALIEKAGLKGHRINDAQISEKHANWIVNRGTATAKDVLELMDRAENAVFGTFGVRLEREIRILTQICRNPAK